MSKKPIRSKRRHDYTDPSAMEKLLLFSACGNYLERGIPLKKNNIDMLLALGKTPMKYKLEQSAIYEAENIKRLQRFVEEATEMYQDHPSDHTREQLVKCLGWANMDIQKYFNDNFEKFRPIDFEEYRQRKTAPPESILSR